MFEAASDRLGVASGQLSREAQTSARGRFDLFGKSSADGRYLRKAVVLDPSAGASTREIARGAGARCAAGAPVQPKRTWRWITAVVIPGE